MFCPPEFQRVGKSGLCRGDLRGQKRGKQPEKGSDPGSAATSLFLRTRVFSGATKNSETNAKRVSDFLKQTRIIYNHKSGHLITNQWLRGTRHSPVCQVNAFAIHCCDHDSRPVSSPLSSSRRRGRLSFPAVAKGIDSRPSLWVGAGHFRWNECRWDGLFGEKDGSGGGGEALFN